MKKFRVLIVAILLLMGCVGLAACDKTITYDVSFYNGSDLIETVSIKKGATEIGMPDSKVPANPGHSFVWTFEDGTAFDVGKVTQDVKVVTQWSANKYTISFDESDEALADIDPIIITYGTKPDENKIPKPEKPEKQLKGWYHLEGSQQVEFDFTQSYNMTKDIKLFANWDDARRVRFLNFDGSVIKSVFAEDGAPMPEAPDAPFRKYHEFVEWQGAVEEIIMDIDVQAVYRYIPIGYTAGDPRGSVILTDENLSDYFDLTLYKNRFYTIAQKSTNDMIFEEVALPAEYNGKPILGFPQNTSESSGAFGKNTSLEIIYIPGVYDRLGERINETEGLRDVSGGYAFFEAVNLKSVTFGYNSQIAWLPKSTFNKCRALKTIDFEGGYTMAPARAGDKARSLITYIGDEAFREAIALESFDIPNGVIEIGKSAFEGNTIDSMSLTSLMIPAVTTKIGDMAFLYNFKLASLDFEEGGTKSLTIGAQAFMHAALLEEVVLPDRLVSIGSEFLSTSPAGFSVEMKLRKITLSAGLTIIPSSAFANNVNLSEVDINGAQLVFIGGSAFYGSALEKFDIPSTLTTIVEHAFKYNYNLKEFNLVGTNHNFAVDSGHLYSADKKTLIHYAPGATAAEFTIPASVEALGDYAFNSASNLKKIVFHQGIIDYGKNLLAYSKITEFKVPSFFTEIPYGMFFECKELVKLVFEETTVFKKIGESAFDECYALTEITLPQSLENIEKYAFRSSGLEGILIPAGINNLGESIFDGCGALKTVTFDPDFSYEHLSSSMFIGCLQLTSINIPDSVKALGNRLFYGCVNLESVTFGEASMLEYIGANAFERCRSLTSIDLPESLLYIDDAAFGGYESESEGDQRCGITELKLPGNIKMLGNSIFLYGKITELVIPDSIIRNRQVMPYSTIKRARGGIGFTLFQLNKFDVTVYIHAEEMVSTDTYTSPFRLKTIAVYVLAELVESYKTTTPWSSKADLYRPLYKVTFDGGDYAVSVPANIYLKDGESFTAPAALESNDANFKFAYWKDAQNNQYLPGETYPVGLNHIDLAAYWVDANTYTVTFLDADGNYIAEREVDSGNAATAPEAPAKRFFSFTGWDRDFSNVTENITVNAIYEYEPADTSLFEFVGVKEDLVTKLTFNGINPDEPETIPAGVLISKKDDAAYPEDLALPLSYTYGEFTFPVLGIVDAMIKEESPFYKTNVKHVYIPATYKLIGDLAFYGENATNAKLLSVEIGRDSQLVRIGKQAFEKQYNLEGISLFSEGLEVIDDSAFAGFMGANGVVSGKMLPEELVIPSTLRSIGNNAFLGWANLKSLRFDVDPETHDSALRTIGSRAFNGVTGIQTLVLPEGLTSIGDGAFSAATLLANTYVPQYTSAGAISLLKSVSLPQTLTSIGMSAFACNINLEWINIPAGILRLEKYVFAGTSTMDMLKLDGVILPEGLQFIGESAFAYNLGLKSLTIPASVNKIDVRAFTYAKNLETLTFDTAAASNLAIGDYAFSCAYKLGSLVLPEGVASIGKYAFAGDSNNEMSIASISIPSTVGIISEFAFAYNSRLTSVNFNVVENEGSKTGVYAIESLAFGYCAALRTLDLPVTLTTLGVSSNGETIVSGSSLLESFTMAGDGEAYKVVAGVLFTLNEKTLTLYPASKPVAVYAVPAGTEIIAAGAFRNSISLTELRLPASLTKIESYAFYGAQMLNAIEFAEGLKEIMSYAFYGAGNLQSIILPDSLKTIGDSAFQSSGLSSVAFGTGVEIIGKMAFAGKAAAKMQIETVVIPGQVSLIGANAFEYGSLSSLTFDESDTELAFDSLGFQFQHNNLTSVNIPKRVSVLAANMFVLNYDLTNITFTARDDGEGGYKSLIVGSFINRLPNLESIVLPEGVTQLGNNALAGTSNEMHKLSSITLPKSLKQIGNGAFSYNSALTDLEINSSGVKFGSLIFEGNTNRVRLYFKDMSVMPSSINGTSFNAFRINVEAIFVPAESVSAFKTERLVVNSGDSDLINRIYAIPTVSAQGQRLLSENLTIVNDNENRIITFGGAGEEIAHNYAGEYLEEGHHIEVQFLLSYTKNTFVYIEGQQFLAEDIVDGANYFSFYGNVTDAKREFEVKIIFPSGETITYAIKVAPETALGSPVSYTATVSDDALQLGGALSYSYDAGGKKITFGGQDQLVLWTPGIGNIVRVKLTVESPATANFILGDETKSVGELLEDADSFHAVIPVSLSEVTEFSILWENGYSITYSVALAGGTKLESEGEVNVREVIAIINALPAAGDLTYEDKTAVMAAREAYDALEAAEKLQISNYEILTDAEAQITLLGLEEAEKIITAPNKTSYTLGEELDLSGAKISSKKYNGDIELITNITAEMVSGYYSGQLGEQNITVTYNSAIIGTFTVTVKNTSITIAAISGYGDNAFSREGSQISYTAMGDNQIWYYDGDEDKNGMEEAGNYVAMRFTVFSTAGTFAYGLHSYEIANLVSVPGLLFFDFYFRLENLDSFTITINIGDFNAAYNVVFIGMELEIPLSAEFDLSITEGEDIESPWYNVSYDAMTGTFKIAAAEFDALYSYWGGEGNLGINGPGFYVSIALANVADPNIEMHVNGLVLPWEVMDDGGQGKPVLVNIDPGSRTGTFSIVWYGRYSRTYTIEIDPGLGFSD